MSTTRMA